MDPWAWTSAATRSLHLATRLILAALWIILPARAIEASTDSVSFVDSSLPTLHQPIRYVEDPQKNMDTAAAAAAMANSSLTLSDISSRVYSEHRYWMALSVEPIATDWVLGITSRTVKSFTIYLLKNGQWQLFPCRLVSMSIHPRCVMPEISGAPQDILVSMEFADTTVFKVLLNRMTAPEQNMTDAEIVFNVLLIGVSLALILFLGIFGWSFRDTYYYYFALYALSFVLFTCLTIGLVTLVHLPWSLNAAQPYFGFLAIFFSANFACRYLNTKVHAPWIHWTIQTIALSSLTLALLRSLGITPVRPGFFIEFASVPVLILTIVAGVRLRRSGLGGIGYFILAWSVFCAFVILILARQYNLWTSDSWIANSLLRIATTTTLTILAISVAKRAQSERSQLLQKLRESNNHLEHEVQARTQKILEQQEIMIQSAKMASLGEMAAGVAHEINNPLAIIQGSAFSLKTMLARGNFDLARATDFSNKVESAIRRISGIVKSLRTLAHEGPSDTQDEIELSNMLSDVVNLVSERFKNEGIELQLHLPTQAISVLGHLGQVEQIMINLLNNAFDAVLHLNQRWVRLDIAVQKDQLGIHITDSGNGIPQNNRDKIFDPFFTTKEVGKGTGLGLPLSRRLAESMNGSLTSSIFEGHTRFTLQLPLAQLGTKTG